MTTAEWRISSYSTNGGSCVEVANLGEETDIRNSNNPDAGTLRFPNAALAGWLAGIKAGEFDDLA